MERVHCCSLGDDQNISGMFFMSCTCHRLWTVSISCIERNSRTISIWWAEIMLFMSTVFSLHIMAKNNMLHHIAQRASSRNRPIVRCVAFL